MTQTFHMSQSVRGPLKNWSPKQWQKATDWITRTDGSKFANGALLKAEFERLLDQGIEKMPYGKCDNFCPKNGCRGHPSPKEVVNA